MTLVAIALAAGCATSGQERKSPAMSAQEQAHKQLQAAQLQQSQAERNTQLNQQRTQQWTRQQDVQGRVVEASGDKLQVRTQDQRLMNLDVTGATAVNVDGRSGSLRRARRSLPDREGATR